jgi:hypothetical protein
LNSLLVNGSMVLDFSGVIFFSDKLANNCKNYLLRCCGR